MRMIARAIVLTFLTIVVMIYVGRQAEGPKGAVADCVVSEVIDAETVVIECRGQIKQRAQLQGVDTPGIEAPRCAEELAHGTLATERFKDLVSKGQVIIARVGEGDIPLLIRLSIDGKDMAERLVREGLAVAYDGGERINWCEKLGAQ